MNLFKHYEKTKAFALIELLVVIAKIILPARVVRHFNPKFSFVPYWNKSINKVWEHLLLGNGY